MNADGSFDYTPDVTFFGTDSFSYRVSDGTVTSNVATVVITVNEVNAPAPNDPPPVVEDNNTTEDNDNDGDDDNSATTPAVAPPAQTAPVTTTNSAPTATHAIADVVQPIGGVIIESGVDFSAATSERELPAYEGRPVLTRLIQQVTTNSPVQVQLATDGDYGADLYGSFLWNSLDSFEQDVQNSMDSDV